MGTSNDCFVAALQKKMKEQGRGAKKLLAANVGVSPNHLSDILAKRKNAGQKLKERISDALDISFEDMLVLGRHLIEGEGDGKAGNAEGNEQSGHVAEADPHKQNKTADFMAMAANILQSKTPYRQALISNITQYSQALEVEQREKKALQMIPWLSGTQVVGRVLLHPSFLLLHPGLFSSNLFSSRIVRS